MAKVVGRRSLRIARSVEEVRLRGLESTTLKKGKLVGKQRTQTLNRSVELIEALGYDAAAKDVKAGKQSAADTFKFIEGRLSSAATRPKGPAWPWRQRIARIAGKAAKEAGI